METEHDLSTEEGLLTTRQIVGFFGGVIVLIAILAVPPPAELSPEGWTVAGIGLLMAVWWITEALPIPVTSLVPIVTFPLLGIVSIEEATAPYANPLIFLFMGGFVIAIAMQRWELHRRIALVIVRTVGVEPRWIIVGFIIAAAFLSMWVSNTATALMMLPIVISIIQLAKARGQDVDPAVLKNFSIVLVLAIAYACNIGGLGTLVGTPPNVFLAGFMLETYGVEVGFLQWMGVGLPIVVLGLPIMYWVLTTVYPIRADVAVGGREIIESELSALGEMTTAEKRVALVFGLTALLWMTRPIIADVVPGLSDAGIAISAALLLFMLPSGMPGGGRILTWERAEELPWGVLLLFGGGLSLASAISETGLAGWIGAAVSGYSAVPLLLLLVIVVAVIIFLTEITSNTATTAAFLPILAGVAIGIGENPFLFAVPAALAASCAFMLPVATPPNAIVYGSGYVSIPEMSKAGLWVNIASIVLVTLLAYLVMGFIFGVEVGVVPEWAS